jgi:hypothetical protein
MVFKAHFSALLIDKTNSENQFKRNSRSANFFIVKNIDFTDLELWIIDLPS